MARHKKAAKIIERRTKNVENPINEFPFEKLTMQKMYLDFVDFVVPSLLEQRI